MNSIDPTDDAGRSPMIINTDVFTGRSRKARCSKLDPHTEEILEMDGRSIPLKEIRAYLAGRGGAVFAERAVVFFAVAPGAAGAAGIAAGDREGDGAGPGGGGGVQP